eukprot:6123116-Amphidinium_carterae.1
MKFVRTVITGKSQVVLRVNREMRIRELRHCDIPEISRESDEWPGWCFRWEAYSRRAGILIGLLNPKLAENKNKEFADFFAEWEEGVQRYETEITGQLADDIKVATVVSHAPEPFRSVLRAASHQFGNNYAQMKVLVEHYTQAGFEYGSSGGQDVVPMDVSALWSKGKGKGTGKDKSKGRKGSNKNKNFTSPGQKGVG